MKVRPISLANREAQYNKRRHRRELRPGGNVLQQCPPTESDDVHVSEDRDQIQARAGARASGPFRRMRKRVFLRNERNNLPQISGRGNRERGDDAAVGHGEQHPSVKKRDQISVGFAQDRCIDRRSRETSIPIRRRRSTHRAKSNAPNTQTSRNKTGCGSGPAISFAVRKSTSR